ncbi:uncharacterized protein Z518_08895 [Rhinocladiella mackenziei CBS 650.93]|uniref:Uncharacterized protein n=1 Tax=Rhinocladiella mackenziei CBS 650.93 TaxID=1442369 RepID=A0A0D2IX29_9EURO|nr:uncharacterized protein Z518_08895 [Rhinocladiella mackenziei CBS 650.93]KIX01170.1 hypothetical protein Z518_08895 [Rhinocladiella mackenziei CBS 650.93]
MTINAVADGIVGKESPPVQTSPLKVVVSSEKYVENIVTNDRNLVYDDNEEEPELHARTYVAILAMFIPNFIQVFALQGPPAVLSYIGISLNDTQAQTGVPNSLSVVQAVLGPVISPTSDPVQSRKTLLVDSSITSLIGSAIAPGFGNIYRLIAAQTLIGVGFLLFLWHTLCPVRFYLGDGDPLS